MPLPQPLLLIGFRGTGKTTVATRLAQRLNIPAADTDHLITLRTTLSIEELFRLHGEPFFRDLETQVLRELMLQSPQVIATGGGIVLCDENRRLLQRGHVIWLHAGADTILRRLLADPTPRPSLTTLPLHEEIAALLAAREPLYAGCADFTVDTDRLSPQDSVDLITRHLADLAWT